MHGPAIGVTATRSVATATGMRPTGRSDRRDDYADLFALLEKEEERYEGSLVGYSIVWFAIRRFTLRVSRARGGSLGETASTTAAFSFRICRTGT